MESKPDEIFFCIYNVKIEGGVWRFPSVKIAILNEILEFSSVKDQSGTKTSAEMQ